MAEAGEQAVQQQGEVQLARDLGLFDASMIGLGAMIGAGIFVLTGLAFKAAGPGAIVTFGLNGIVSAFTALSYAELASAIPEAGGGYSFVRRAMPRWASPAAPSSAACSPATWPARRLAARWPCSAPSAR